MAQARGWSYSELILRMFETTRAALHRKESVERIAGGTTARPARRARKAATA